MRVHHHVNRVRTVIAVPATFALAHAQRHAAAVHAVVFVKSVRHTIVILWVVVIDAKAVVLTVRTVKMAVVLVVAGLVRFVRITSAFLLIVVHARDAGSQAVKVHVIPITVNRAMEQRAVKTVARVIRRLV